MARSARSGKHYSGLNSLDRVNSRAGSAVLRRRRTYALIQATATGQRNPAMKRDVYSNP